MRNGAVRAPTGFFGSRVARALVLFGVLGLVSQGCLYIVLSKELGFTTWCGPSFYASEKRFTALLGACRSIQPIVSER